MTKKNTRRGGVIYAVCLYLWGLLLLGGAVWLLGGAWKYAEAYEASRPNAAMERYVQNLSKELWDEGVAQTVAAMPHEVQSDEEVAVHVQKLLSEGVDYLRKSGGEGHAVYALRCNGKTFGTVTLVEDREAEPEIDVKAFPWRLLPWSLKPWKVESEEFDFRGLYSSVEAVVPRSFSVWLNGTRLGTQYIVEEGIPFDSLAEYYDDYEGLPTKVRYRFDNAIGRLVPEIRDEDGEIFSLDRGRDDSQFIKPCSEAELKRLADFAAGFVVNYLKYTSGAIDPTYGYKKLTPYLLPGAALDERMKGAIDGQSWAHTDSVSVDSSTLNSALSLGDGCYVLDISADTTTFVHGKGEIKNTNNMRVMCVKKNDDIRAISLELY